MNTKRNTNTEVFESPGERLNHLLDQIGFKQGRGRVTAFRNYLMKTSPEQFSDLKYTTTRSWFQEHSPPMWKIDSVIDALQKEYPISEDEQRIKSWWKIGGESPFINSSFDEKRAEFTASTVLISIKGAETLNGESLVSLREQLVKFLNDFSNPSLRECPTEYLHPIAHYLVEQKLSDS